MDQQQLLMIGGAAAGGVVVGAVIAGWWQGIRGRRALESSRSAAHARVEALQHEHAALEREHAATSARAERLPAVERQLARLEESYRELERRHAAQTAGRESADARLREQTARAERLDAELADLRARYHDLDARLQRREAEFASRERATDEKLALLNDAERQLKQQFENVANRLFEQKAESFNARSRETLDNVLNPFRERLQDLQKQVQTAYESEARERHTLKHEIEQLVRAQSELSDQARSLTNALTADNKQQGNWGEFVLERLLEDSGLRRDSEYVVQRRYPGADGAKQPDVIIHLPDRRDIVVDSKVSLKDYHDAMNADDGPSREAALRRHVGSMRAHIRQLAERRYEEIPEIRSLDYTVMFVPLEPAYFAALQADPELVNAAWERRVVPVCPTTLMAVLRIIERIWQSERQTRNLQEIVATGGRLYDKLRGFVESFEAIDQHLDRARDSYQQAHGRLASGKGNAISLAQRLKHLGVKPRQSLDAGIARQAEESDAEGGGGED